MAASHQGETMQIWHGLYRGSLKRWPIGGEREGSWKPKKSKEKEGGEKKMERGTEYSGESQTIAWESQSETWP